MGLDTSHDAWHGAYSAFMGWREKICAVAGFPPLKLMEGFFERNSPYDPMQKHAEWVAQIRGTGSNVDDIYWGLPIRWQSLKPSPLFELLSHSDCDGSIDAELCGPIADALERLLPELDSEGGGHIGNYAEKTRQFIKGLRAAAKEKKPLKFH